MELNRNVLKNCTLWAMLPWEVVITLMAELVPVVFPPMHTVVVEGLPSSGLHFIEQGMVTVLQKQKVPSPSQRQEEGEAAEEVLEREIGTMGDAEFFGEAPAPLLAITCRYSMRLAVTRRYSPLLVATHHFSSRDSPPCHMAVSHTCELTALAMPCR